MSANPAVAIALSADDIPDGGQMLVHSCEDCACPVTRQQPDRRATSVPTGARLVQAGEVVELSLDEGHVALFNPYGNGGVVVVNEPGVNFLRRFGTARAASEVVTSDADRELLVRLVSHDLLHESGNKPRLAYHESTELTAWLHVTNACNLRCPYCYIHKSKDRMDDSVGRAAIDALVRSAVDNGFRSLRLKYAGGEASLNTATLFAVHDHAIEQAAAHGLGLSAVILSNGVAVPELLARELASRDIRVMISLDGLGAMHDELRPTVNGRPSSSQVVATVDRLVRIGLPPHISITITRRNVSGVADVVRFALERGLTFSFNFFRDNSCQATFADLQYEEQEMIAGLFDAFGVIGELLPRWSVLGSVLDRGQLLQPRKRSCGVGDDYVVIDQNGQVAQCHMEMDATLGNIRTVDPVRAVRGATGGIRNLLVDEKSGCRTCSWQNWCSGGCSVATFRATGRFDVRSPNCGIYKAIYPEALKLEARRILAYAVRPAH